MGCIFGVDLKHDPFEEVSRAEWGARPPLARPPLEPPVTMVVVHFTHDEPCTTREECGKRVRELQRSHMDDKNHIDIKYNFLIGADGAVYEGRGWHVEGLEVPLMHIDFDDDITCIDVAFIGTVEDVETKMPQMLKTFKDFIKASKLKRVLKMENLYLWMEGGDREWAEERKKLRERIRARKKLAKEKAMAK